MQHVSLGTRKTTSYKSRHPLHTRLTIIMPFRIATRLSKHRRSNPLKQCQPRSSDCMKPLPRLSMSPFSSTQRHPCDYLHSHVVVENTNARFEEDSSAFSTPTPYTSMVPSTTTLLHGSQSITSTTSQQIWPYSLKFISSSLNDLCTSQEGVACDIPAPQNTPEVVLDPYGYEESIELPLIREQDFQYYPTSKMEMQTTESEGKRDVEQSSMIKEEVKKKRWEGFWLKRVVSRGLKKLGLRSM